ncbi:hypothetical protein [Planctomyces sp. SH-PL62]|uniref:hypothetical protein n=1 Tax=Planctomyces sp. SH-PL62 TaxID=1636152 RepID=UPI00078E0ABB|nr:hypothetical protein [Planctomyces sp. SH-PL62]AMV36509.1 hypothetical protein VT85_03690 [Planctomyces sp. SH-PL62]
MSMSNEVPARRPRRWRLWVGLALIILAVPVALFAALPWIASSPWAKPRIEAAANRVLAPGGVAFDRIRVSWFRPTEIDAPALLDANGSRLVAAPTGTFSWNLWQILFARPVVGTLALQKGAVEIGRSTEGDVDLLETLKPILQDKPPHTIQIRIEGATLKFTQEGVADPFYADHADIAIDLARYPEPISWDLKLARDKPAAEPGRMNIAGSLGRADDLDGLMRNASLAVTGDGWPWRITPTFGDLEGLATSGEFSGSLAAGTIDGVLTTEGDAHIHDFLAEGPKLSGDQFRQAELNVGWKAQGRDGVYQIERFAFDAPAATLSAVGEFPPAADRSAKLQGRVDLAALAGQLRRTLRLQDDVTIEKGAVELFAEAKARPDPAAGQRIEVTAKLADLAAKKGASQIVWNDATTLVVRLDRTADAVTLDQLDVQTPFLTATGKGNLDEGIVVDAAYDLAEAQKRLRDWVDVGAFEASGQGTLQARYRREQSRYLLDADGAIRALVLKGLPVVETLTRAEVRGELAVRGDAEPSGLPRDWRYVSFQGRSAEDELKLETTSDADKPTPTMVKALARTTMDLGGDNAKRIVEVAGSVVAGPESVDASNLKVSSAPVAEPGGTIPPEEPYVWRGSARYDVKKDELKLTRRDPDAGADEKPPAFSVDHVLAGGFRSKGAAWFQVDLSGDLVAIQDVVGMTKPQAAGLLAAEVDGKQNGDLWDLDAVVQVRELVQLQANGGKRDVGEVTLTLDSKIAVKERRLDLARLALDTPYLRADAQGSVTELGEAPVVDLHGMLAPDWERLTRELASRVEPNASVRGRPHPWSLAGRIPLGKKARDEPSTLDGEAGLQLDLVDVFGMRLEKTTLVIRTVDGELEISPIDAMLNGGRLKLDPAIAKDEMGKSWLSLGRGSSLAEAVVNDEVSHRVLAYVAPVLDQSTRVEGKVSFDLVDARFSLDGDATKTQVEGDVQFDDVRFMPGPLVDQLINTFNLERKAIFVLRDPVSIRILGRTIYQEGLILPVGDVAVIGIEGWMDFDKRIDMLATFAVVPPQRNIPVVSLLLENARIQVPLTGTLDNPKINGERIKEGFKDFGESLLETTLSVGAGIGDLFRRGGGRAQPAPPVEVVPPLEGPERGAPRDAPPPPPPATRDRDVAPPPPNPGLDPDAELLLPGFRLPFSRTPEERQLQKEIRQQRRQDRRADRRARQGRPLD